ncbi:uncharacterized protein [Miscanthus floridulus]|uniref:uncharacterized protein isoform X2 n=1 Tax=Miscanthus floridulus TaxID=154761 RepID=UPI003458C93A
MRSPTAVAGSAADFSDALPSPTSPAAVPCHSSPGRHYYLAVDRTQFKMRRGHSWSSWGLSRIAAVGCRLQHVFPPVMSLMPSVLPSPTSPLCQCHRCDQAEAERASVLEMFRQETIQWNQTTKATNIAESSRLESTGSKLSIVVATDACLPQATMAEAPLMARVLINYELPTKKEAYLRRMSTCLAADGIVINMVVGGEVATLKALEENSGLLIAEMPIHVSEIL